MKSFFIAIYSNKILMTTISAWLIAQAIKVGIGVFRKKKFDFRLFIGSGGMPSSHASGASCLAMSVGLDCGFDSVYFALAFAFAIVVMFDAQGVRRATGKQAVILNKIMDDIYWQGKMQETRLRELIGHTPIEVIMGLLLGIAIALLSRI
ncbi:MAG: divergent PAP2 family protein [Candidatus Omnitrophica bacterium]|nr:divergent PAP2 family protein [Candidatus Omnitrophota bacterium]MDD5500430.1 divergent PAP2 family protein [Candidatus Omnitrophota bacterium]